MKRTISLVILLAFIAINASAQQKPSFIPQPDDIAWMEGSFLIDKKTSLSCESATLRPAADYLSGIIAKATGITPSQKKRGGTIRLAVADNIKAGGYMLNISPKLVTITGGDYQGVVAGISTLRQMLPSSSAVGGAVTLPSCKILDTPRFAWRGMELDCSRHFFTKEEVMELLDVLALYKVNKFHWHLTDDQGWRIEIKKYPLLTERGAWRTPNNQDSVCMRNAVTQDNPDLQLPTKNINAKGEYGGFYTQDDIREIVAFARQRGIDIVPEIDIPGHSLSAIDNYDGLSCKERTGWGQFFTTPLCPGKDRVLEFCK
ncbi:MAG: beta-N-acetylhexosaminidase, partial [Prevotella sp.]|nr:beta-N-acetylhexosaminidase [Prevotella sp.]